MRWLSASLQAAARAWSDRRGGIAIMSGVMFSVAIICAAFAIDLGSLFLEKRRIQGVVDLAAMAAAGDIANAQAAARATLVANRVDLANTDLKVELGHYAPDTTAAVGARFQIGALPLNAARVTLTRPVDIYFAKTFMNDCCKVSVSALAANAQVATFSVGSRLAALREGVVNQLLSGLLGGNVTLSVADYNAIATANVGMFQFGQALASELNLSAVSYKDVMAADVTVGNVIKAMASVAPDATTRAALNSLAAESSASFVKVPMSQVMSFGPLENLGVGDALSFPDPRFNVMDVVMAAASISGNGRLISLDLGVSVPGVAKLTLDVAIGDPVQQSPWAAVGEVQAKVHTAQIRIRLVAEVGGSGLLAATRVRLPIYIDGAYGTGRLASIACANDGTGAVSVAARPGIAAAHIGEVSNWDLTSFNPHVSPTKATLVDLALIKVKGRASIDVTNTSETTVSFNQTEITNGAVKRVSTRNIAETLVSSLLSNLSLELGPLTLPAIDPLVRSVLTGVAQPLDQVVYTLLSSLGIRLGEVDVRVHGVRCRSSVLAG
jgi:uncharacterized membrane protein